MNYLTDLHATLSQRARPEKIAHIIMSGNGTWTPEQHRCLESAAGRWNEGFYYSSMPDEFERVPDALPQLDTVRTVFGTTGNARPDDVRSLLALVDDLGNPLGWDHYSDWTVHRLTHPQRRQAMISVTGRRAYKRRIRALHHLTEKAHRMGKALYRRDLIREGRSGFAHAIPLAQFEADPDAAMFIAYITARKNLRREFTLSGKDNPVDRCAEMLFSRLHAGSSWDMIALAWPKPDVLAHLTSEQLGVLAARWMKVMRECSDMLSGLWVSLIAHSNFSRSKMIVRRGMDSSTWNEVAQAYNAARAGWLGCLSATPGGLSLTEAMLPGKVMRLMAADLVYWHSRRESGVDPDTAVWASLPLPWHVFAGLRDCPASLVREKCCLTGMNPDATGWTLPLPKGEAADIKPTPELVHGVTISDPAWAQALRSAGVFAGHGGRGRKPADDAAALRASAGQAGVIDSELPLASGIVAGYDEDITP